jgi:leucyl/phenylalanyl-tRNA--protein transferase
MTRSEPQDADGLTPEVVLAGYAQGIFPMADPDDGLMHWFSPNPRAILPLDDFHVPRSLERTVQAGIYQIRVDHDFDAVIQACAAPRAEDDSTWIDHRIREAFIQLHHLGFAHCIEAWSSDVMVGGLYGVALGGAFFGESMFSDPEHGRDASKVCLVHLVDHLTRCGFALLDVQFTTAHLEQFGCREIPREEFMDLLQTAIGRGTCWRDPEGESCDSDH